MQPMEKSGDQVYFLATDGNDGSQASLPAQPRIVEKAEAYLHVSNTSRLTNLLDFSKNLCSHFKTHLYWRSKLILWNFDTINEITWNVYFNSHVFNSVWCKLVLNSWRCKTQMCNTYISYIRHSSIVYTIYVINVCHFCHRMQFVKPLLHI